MKSLFVVVLAGLSSFVSVQEPEAKIEDVVFKAKCDESEQRYVLMLPAGYREDEPHDVLIALHGHGADRWQFASDPRDECRAARDVAAKHAMIYVSPDYRARTSWMGPKAEADVVQIIDELHERRRVSRVFVCGGSMGGTALDPAGVKAVASMPSREELIAQIVSCIGAPASNIAGAIGAPASNIAGILKTIEERAAA